MALAVSAFIALRCAHQARYSRTSLGLVHVGKRHTQAVQRLTIRLADPKATAANAAWLKS